MPIRVEGLEKNYGRIWALRGVSLEVEEGYTYALVGPNGSGKTTLIKTILGLVRPSRGTVLVDDYPAGHREAKRLLSYVPEVPEAPGWLTVERLLDVVGRLEGLGPAERASEARRVLKLLGVPNLGARPVGGLSKGQRKRVLIAASLMGIENKKYYLLDEPLTGLDPEAVETVRELMAGLSREGKTLLVSSHILKELETIANRLIIIYRGILLYKGTLEDLAETVRAKPSITVRTPDPALAARILESHGYKPDIITSAGLKLYVDDASEADKILDLLKSAGVKITAYQVTEGTLEDAYRMLVKRYLERGGKGA